MKRQIGLVRTCVIGAVLSGAGWVLPGALAQAAELPVKAPAAEAVPYWWFHGTIEAGGRFFLNNPQQNGSVYLGQNSLAKYYEYSTIKPGPFGNVWMATGSSDGLYQVDLGGKNIGYSDQSYYLDLSKAGEHYLSLGWDQTPHFYSNSAQTPYLGVGTTTLTLPAGMPTNAPGTNNSIIVPYLHQTDLGIRRDTASVEYRWTPTDAWDVKADLSHMHRYGTQVEGVVGLNASATSGFNPVQVPRPVDDTTQNFGLNGEYAGTSPWGQKFNLKLAYNGSQYSDDFTSYLVQNPYCTSAGVCFGGATRPSPFARISTWPSNNANSFSATLGADLPWKSRYAGTLSYTMMRQDDAFIPMTNNPNALPSVNILPASSLNGAINTLLSNNIITTHITPDLDSKLSYRYYDFQNNTPEIVFANWTSYDRDTPNHTDPWSSLSMQYTKQNADAQLAWRPTREWHVGAAYGYERYDWTRADADVTNENSGKVFADWKPASWATLRASGYYAVRRYENYDYNKFVASIQFPGQGAIPANEWAYATTYRQFMLNNRDRWKANLSADVVVLPGVTVTPTFKYQDDKYELDPYSQQGLADSRGLSGGVDVTYVINPDTSVMVGYMHEFYTRLLYGASIGDMTNDRTAVDTFTAMARYAAIPDKLDLSLRYTLSRGVDHQQLFLASGAAPTGGQFPDVTTWFQRLDATAVYAFDPTVVAQLGWKGKVKAKLHYAWERNSVSNWSNDPLDPNGLIVASGPNAIWMAYDNPNYNVHMLMASLAFTW
jgi:MtrB/PioB family decaheme-associated outer membrane protein